MAYTKHGRGAAGVGSARRFGDFGIEQLRIRDAKIVESLKNIESLNVEKYKNKIVFIKSCKNKLLPVAAFSIISGILLPHVKSLFYGEPCSSIPLIKN